jgi:hypothetical protein
LEIINFNAMNAHTLKTRLALIAFSFLIATSFAQVQINCDVTPVQMVEHFFGPGIFVFDNVSFTGADEARGLFSDAANSLYMESGIFLCTGNGYLIPGPNISGTTGIDNGTPGNAILNSISTQTTYNASVLEFDFIPVNDSLRFNYSFGSEEYNESVNTMWNDLGAAFITGPNPMGGQYSNKKITIVPGTVSSTVSINTVNNGWSETGVVPTGPCMNCAYYYDNTGGLDLEYDGRTVPLPAWILVIPFEEYHVMIGVADVAGPGKDSGIFLEEHSLFSPGPAEFTSFSFLMEDNPELPYDITGVISNQTVYLAVPQNTDVTSLVASYTDKGACVRVDEVMQESGVTANDFSNPIVYQLHGHDIKDWIVNVEIVVDVPQVSFNQVTIAPNPSKGIIQLDNIKDISIILMDVQGKRIFSSNGFHEQSSILIDDLQPGVYLVELRKGGTKETRKVVVN